MSPSFETRTLQTGCGPCTGGEREKVAERSQNGSAKEEELWCNLGKQNCPPLPAESRTSHVRDGLVEPAQSGRLPCSLISGPNEL